MSSGGEAVKQGETKLRKKGGIDLIIFTGGVGENSDVTRADVCTGLEFLGIDFDFEKNIGVRGTDMVLTKEGSKTIVMSITTNEEFVIAQDTYRIVTNI